MEEFRYFNLSSAETRTDAKVWNSVYLRIVLLQENWQKWTHKIINSSLETSFQYFWNPKKKLYRKSSSTWDITKFKSLMEHVPITRPFLPLLLTGWASSGFGIGVFLGLAATWLGDGALSPLTASIQNVFCITALEGTWLSIPLEMSQADLGKNKGLFRLLQAIS